MSLRDTTDTTKLIAHRILDLVKAGQPVEQSRVDWALVILGDYTELTND